MASMPPPSPPRPSRSDRNFQPPENSKNSENSKKERNCQFLKDCEKLEKKRKRAEEDKEKSKKKNERSLFARIFFPWRRHSVGPQNESNINLAANKQMERPNWLGIDKNNPMINPNLLDASPIEFSGNEMFLLSTSSSGSDNQSVIKGPPAKKGRKRK